MPLYQRGPRPKKDEQPLSPVTVALLLVVTGAFIYWVANRTPPVPKVDHTVTLVDIGPFLAVDVLGGDGWVVTVNTAWAGMRDRETARSTCKAVATRLGRKGAQTVTIATPDGDPVVECPSPRDQ